MKENKEFIDLENVMISKFTGGIRNTINPQRISCIQALMEIENGLYDQQIQELRHDVKTYKLNKENLDYYVWSCTCFKRKSDSVEKVNGLLCLDIDGLESTQHAESLKDDFRSDDFVIAAWISPSGKGLKVLCYYDQKEISLKEAFRHASEYFRINYTLTIDKACSDITRACYVSSDREIWINLKALCLPIHKPSKDIVKSSAVSNTCNVDLEELERCIKKLENNNMNIAESYDNWIVIGFVLVSNLGESGRRFYHRISALSNKYNKLECNSKYDHLLNNNNAELPIGVLYRMSKFKNYDKKMNSLLQAMELITSQQLKFNELIRYIEYPNGKKLETRDFNTLFLQLRMKGASISDKMFLQIIDSNHTPSYHPLKEIYKNFCAIKSNNEVGLLFESLNYLKKGSLIDKIILRFLLQIPAAINGQVAELLLVLIGPQGNGKTEFFKRLLPTEMYPYFTIDKLDKGKDSDILMTQKLLVLDDEFAGKSKKDSSHLKALLSQHSFSLRRPYGRVNEDLKRLAVLAGTSNVPDVIYDNTGNRRIIPVDLISRDFQLFDSIDKKKLWAEIFQMWEKDRESHKLTSQESKFLQEYSASFTLTNYEREMIQSFINKAQSNEKGALKMSASQIANFIKDCTKRSLSPVKVGQELNLLKFEQHRTSKKREYWVKLSYDLKPYEIHGLSALSI